LLLSALWQGDIDRQQALAHSSNGAAAWHTAAMAHGSNGTQQQWHMAASAGSVMLTVNLTRLNTDLL